MASRSTNKQLQMADAAALAAVQLSPWVDASLRQWLAPVLEAGKDLPSLHPVSDLIGRLIQSAAMRLLELEDHYAQAQMAERALRAELETLADPLRAELAQVRLLLRQAFGKSHGIELLANRSALARVSPRQLARFGRQVVEILKAPGFQFPTPVATLTSLQRPAPLAVAQVLEQVLLPVENLLATQRPGQTATAIGKGARDQQRAELQDRLHRSLKFLEGSFALANLDYHAERVRALTRRPRKHRRHSPATSKTADPRPPATSSSARPGPG